MMSRRVAVIGGGPAGLSMLDQLLCLPGFSISVFERRTAFGGVWCYDQDPGACVVRFDTTGRAHALWQGARKDGDDRGTFRPKGAMYDGLRTNLPCDIMAYRSYPYNPSESLFPDRAAVESYVKSFAETIIQNHPRVDIRLGTAVQSVKRLSHNDDDEVGRIGWGSVWGVTSIDVDTGEETHEQFDHVVVASGRCNTPTIPWVDGLHRFKGVILHSAWWRSPLPFENKTVLVVGNSSSGSDIARELSGYVVRTLPEGQLATREFVNRCNSAQSNQVGKVLHSYHTVDKPPPLDYDPRDASSPDWAKRITVLPKIQSIQPPSHHGTGSVVFQDGQTRDDIDVIIFGTGYAYDLPYLDHTIAPFNPNPLIPSTASHSNHPVEQLAHVYEPPYPTASYLTNLDDWSLFYAPDPSLCVLGAPARIVPMPFTQVQSRIVAAAWSGNIQRATASTALPRLDRTIPTTDPAKWSSTITTPQPDEQQQPNVTSDLGHPSDTAYQDALLNLLPPHLRLSAEQESLKVPQPSSSDTATDESLKPVGATHEGWARISDFRNQRRQDAKRLRRLLLGY